MAETSKKKRSRGPQSVYKAEYNKGSEADLLAAKVFTHLDMGVQGGIKHLIKTYAKEAGIKL